MTKASVCQTTQSAPFLPSYSITLPHTHTHREHTHRDTRRDTRPHTQCCCMLANVSTYMHTQCLFFCSLASGSTSQCPVPKQDTGCLGSVCTRPTPPLGQLTDPPYKVHIFVLPKSHWDCPVPSFGNGPSLGTCETWVWPSMHFSQCNVFSVQPTVLLTHSLAKPMNITSAPIFKYLVEVLECPCTLKYMPSMVCLVPVIELLGQQYTKWCQVPCLCCLCLEIWSCSISPFELGHSQGLDLALGFDKFVPCLEFDPKCFTPDLLWPPWQPTLLQVLTEDVAKNLLSDPPSPHNA